jgi:hypothetical protein
LAGGANHCNFRFSRLPSDQDDVRVCFGSL